MKVVTNPHHLFWKKKILDSLNNRTVSSNITFHTDNIYIKKRMLGFIDQSTVAGHESQAELFFSLFCLENTKTKEISIVCKFTLSKIGYSALKRVQANWTISSLVPGSCPPNWLHGKARISKPEVTSD